MSLFIRNSGAVIRSCRSGKAYFIQNLPKNITKLNHNRSMRYFSASSQTNTATDHTPSKSASQKIVLKGDAEQKEFQAETRMLLDIVARSLYSDKEVFIRELISNASDALEKFRYSLVSGGALKDELESVDRPLDIKILTDKQNRTITIQDSGIGMTKEELISNLGTIARSGSKSFIQQIKDKGAEQASTIIGQFGVGFYSAFMVADKIEVFTRSTKQGSPGLMWTSDGSGTYKIQEVDGVDIGTKIVVYLKTECREFSDDNQVKDIIKRYSNFVSSPIYLNDEKVNSIKPIWQLEPKEVNKEQHIEFYKFISNSYDKPRFILHYKTDAPLSIKAVFYIPEGKPGLFELSRDADVGVALYSRNILIKSKAENVLPKWLRFVKGVVDSEDIPLNLSRELLQNSALIAKLRHVLTNRVLKFLHERSVKDPVEYEHFYRDYSLFLKEGIVISQSVVEREEIAKLLRFESSKSAPGTKISLADYVARQTADAKTVFYLAAPSRALAESSPYFESMRKQEQEVLFCYDLYDELVLMELKTFQGKNLISVENNMLNESDDKEENIADSAGLNSAQIADLTSFISRVLNDKVFGVRTTRKLDSHPCVVTVAEMAAARHFMRTNTQQMSDENRFALLQPKLEINPKHAIIVKLHKLMSTDKELADMLTNQLFNNAMVTAGLIADPRSLINNINALLAKALEKY